MQALWDELEPGQERKQDAAYFASFLEEEEEEDGHRSRKLLSFDEDEGQCSKDSGDCQEPLENRFLKKSSPTTHVEKETFSQEAEEAEGQCSKDSGDCQEPLENRFLKKSSPEDYVEKETFNQEAEEADEEECDSEEESEAVMACRNLLAKAETLERELAQSQVWP